MHWSSDTGTIDQATKIYEDTLDKRIMGLALAPGGAVDFAAKRDSEILRIENAANAGPNSGAAFRGTTSTGEQATAIANLGDKTYLVEGGQLSVIEVEGHTATSLPDPAAGAVASSLVADTERNVLFVGTSRSTLTDEVLTLGSDGAFLPGAYDHDFANVTTMAFAPNGGLYIVHDPFAALSPGVDMPGQGEVFLRAKTAPNPPDVKFTAQPAAVVKSGALSFAFEASTAPAPASFQCRVDTGTPFACDGTYETDSLGEGAHSLTVRAANGTTDNAADFGVAEQVGFTIDDTKPELAIDTRTAKIAVGGKLRLLFTARDKTPVAYTCQVDAGAAFGCGSPEDLVLGLGPHTITVTATDSAGNVSDPATWNVTAVPAPPVPVLTPATGGGTTVPVAPASAPRTPIVAPVTKAAPKIDINVPCVAVSASRRERARYELAGRRAVLSYRAPAKARFAKFTLRRAAGSRRDVPIVETLGYARVGRSAAHRSTVALTATQRRMVRNGRMRLAVAYGTCRTQVGRWQWVSESDTARKGQR